MIAKPSRAAFRVSSIAFAFRLRNTPGRVVDLGLKSATRSLRSVLGVRPMSSRASIARLLSASSGSLLFCMRTLVGQRSADTA